MVRRTDQIYLHMGRFLERQLLYKTMYFDKIEQFVAAFPRRGKAMFKVVNHTVELILFTYLLPYAWVYFYTAVKSGQTSPALGLPMYVVQAAPLVGFALTAFRVLQRWISEFRVVIRKEKETKCQQ